MKPRLRFRPQAEDDLAQAIDWYNQQRAGLGAEFLRAIDDAAARMQRFPLTYPVAFGDIRKASVRRFPYSLYYKILSDEILVTACFHHSRDPAIWNSRS